MTPKSLTFGQFSYVIRKRLQLKEYESLIFFINGKTIPCHSESISLIHERYAIDDILNLVYTDECVFG